MRLLLLPMLLAVGMPTCSFFGWGGGGNQQRQAAQQAAQSAEQIPGSAKGGWLPGFLPGGCPPITEATRAEVSNWIYTAARQQGMAVANEQNPNVAHMTLTSLIVAPSRTLPCGVYAQWTALYSFQDQAFSRSCTIPGSADLPRATAGGIDPMAMEPLKTWAHMVYSNYWQPDVDTAVANFYRKNMGAAGLPPR